MLQKLIKKFKNSAGATTKRQIQLKELNLVLPKGKEDLYSSIALAHNDMARRATGHTPEVKTKSVEWFAEIFTDNDPFKLSDRDSFDVWHKDTCANYCKYMNNESFPKQFKMTHGRAQKVLNMTFKYLYCTDSYKTEVEKIDEWLHMTLDGYTLRWYKDEIVPTMGLKKGDVPEWSKMDKGQYEPIKDNIRGYLKDTTDYKYTINTETIQAEEEEKQKVKKLEVEIDIEQLSPFYAEFIVWEGEIVRFKLENLFKGLNGIYKSWNEDEWAVNSDVKKELENKIKTLSSKI